MKTNYGFVEPQITEDQWTLELGGSGRFNEINPTGNWEKYLPGAEYQSTGGYDTNACYIYGSLNVLETLTNFLKPELMGTVNYSERWVAKHIPHKPNGGNPHEAMEVIRKTGVIAESLLPFENIHSHEEYLNIDETIQMGIESNRWHVRNNFQHDWLFTKDSPDKAIKIRRGLKESPLGASVYAWHIGPDGMYIKDKGQNDNHWVEIYSMNDDGSYNIYDTYDMTKKRLAPDYDFGYAKRISLTPNTSQSFWLSDIIKRLWK